MTESKKSPLETFLAAVHNIRATGGGVDETSYYGTLESLFNEIGKQLKPSVFCVLQLANQGEGSPDAGFYTEDQRKKKKGHDVLQGQKPLRGALEIKPPSLEWDEVLTGNSAKYKREREQVEKYLKAYRQVLVTNLRDWRLLRLDENGKPALVEGYRLAETEREFWESAGHPLKTTKIHGTRFREYLKRVMLYAVALADPKDVAFFLASFAQDALARIEAVEDLEALAGVRTALEEALGLKFEGEKGEHFFRSSLIQTLFYGVFSAWVLWGRQRKNDVKDKFDWRLTSHLLRLPILGALFYQISDPRRLGRPH